MFFFQAFKTSPVLLLAVLLCKLLIVASLFAISSASYIDLLYNLATIYAELVALRERVVVKAL